jgi:hypothetical protein
VGKGEAAVKYGDAIEYTAPEGLGVMPLEGGKKFVEGVTVTAGDKGMYVDVLPPAMGEGWHLTRVEVDGVMYYVPAHEDMFKADNG